MTVTVKPFGCMPSSGVSTGSSRSITELYPEGIFLPIETNGDGAVNVYSRVQMQLFKARQKAEAEYREVLAASGMDQAAAERTAREVREVENPSLPGAQRRHGGNGGSTASWK